MYQFFNYSETFEFNANLEFYLIRFATFRFDWFRLRKFKKVGRTKSNVLALCNFFKFFMIRFNRIELAPYPNKPLDAMVFEAKEALN